MARSSIERTRSGEYRLRLNDAERALLRMLHAELRMLLDEPSDPDLQRLFPPAHEDPEREAEYRGLVGDQLLDGRTRALETVERALEGETLSAEEADAWLRVLNDLRLILGTRLDVTEETMLQELDRDDPKAQELAVYGYLSWLQEQLVAALAADVPAGPQAEPDSS
jgi:Domain of unknown function (DUF2017)